MNDTISIPVLTIGTMQFDVLSLLIGALIGMLFVGMILLDRFKVANKKITDEISVLEDEKMALSQNLVREQTQNQALQEQMNIRKSDEKLFETQFENLAHKIFDEKTTKFKEQNQESLGQILNPLKDRLNDFQKKVDDSFGTQAKEQFALKEQIKSIVEANDKITFQAENLATALKGDSKTQGDWGEVILERILADAGLRKGIDYIT